MKCAACCMRHASRDTTKTRHTFKLLHSNCTPLFGSPKLLMSPQQKCRSSKFHGLDSSRKSPLYSDCCCRKCQWPTKPRSGPEFPLLVLHHVFTIPPIRSNSSTTSSSTRIHSIRIRFRLCTGHNKSDNARPISLNLPVGDES